MDKATRDYLKRLARRGGKARAKKLTVTERRESARKASLARWEKAKKPIPKPTAQE